MKNHFDIKSLENFEAIELTNDEALLIDGGDAALFGEFCGRVIGSVICAGMMATTAIVGAMGGKIVK